MQIKEEIIIADGYNLCCLVKIPKNIEKPKRTEMLKQGTIGMEVVTWSPAKNYVKS